MYVCMYVCTYVCNLYVCMYVCMYVCVCVYVYLYVCMYVCMYIACVYNVLVTSFVSFQAKNFINDTIRSEFHRKFMDKYVK